MDAAQFLKGAGGRRTETVYLSPDPDALSAAQVAAKATGGGSLADAPPEVEQARKAALDTSWQFTVSSIGASQWQWLIDQHPPTDAQQAAAKAEGARLRFNPETLPVVATAACLRSATNPDGETLTFDAPSWGADGGVHVDPSALELANMSWDTFPLGDTSVLWGAVLDLNGTSHSSQVQSFARGSAKTRSGVR